MFQHKVVALPVLTLTVVVLANAADVTGKWTAEFDTQIGVQKYTYELKVDGTKLTGKAIGKRGDSEAAVEIQEGKVNGDETPEWRALRFRADNYGIQRVKLYRYH